MKMKVDMLPTAYWVFIRTLMMMISDLLFGFAANRALLYLEPNSWSILFFWFEEGVSVKSIGGAFSLFEMPKSVRTHVLFMRRSKRSKSAGKVVTALIRIVLLTA